MALIQKHLNPTTIAFSSSGGLLAVADYDISRVEMFSVDAGGNMTATSTSYANYPYAVAFSPADNLLASADQGAGQLSLYSVTSAGVISSAGAAGPLTGPLGVAFSPLGGILAGADEGGDQLAMFSAVAPSCQSASTSIAENTPVTVSLACSDPGGLPESDTIKTAAAHGTLSTVDPSTHTVTYTPSSGYTGTDSFTYLASTATGTSTSQTETIAVIGPPSAAISSPSAGGTYNAGQSVPTAFSCTDGAGGPGISSCLDSNGNASPGHLDTSTGGTHTYTVTATSSDGQTATAHISYTVIAPPSATINSPADNSSYNVGQTVSTSFACTESANGPGVSTCTDSNGDASPGGHLDTATAGTRTYTVTAASSDGQTGTTHITYTVIGPPTVTLPQPTYMVYAALNDRSFDMPFSCTEAANGPGISSCTDSTGGAPPYGIPDTSTLGPHTYTVTATSADGQSANKSLAYTVAGAPSANLLAPSPNGIYAVGQAVYTHYDCTDGAYGPGIARCSDAFNGVYGYGQLLTSRPGAYMYSVTAISTDGQTTASYYPYTVAAAPTAAITAPSDGGTYAVGQQVPTRFSCAEGASGPGISSCADSDGADASGGRLDTTTPGAHTYTVTATSSDGQTGTAHITYTVAAVPAAAIASPSGGGTYAVAQQVATSFSCTEGASGPGISACADSAGADAPGGKLDTTTPGAHTYTVTATSSDGQTATAHISYTVAAAPSALIGSPGSGGTYAVGQHVPTSFSCAEGARGPGISTCADSHGGTAPGGQLDTSTPGTHTYTVTATSSDGQTGTAHISYTIAAASSPLPGAPPALPPTSTPPAPTPTPPALIVRVPGLSRPSLSRLLSRGERLQVLCSHACSLRATLVIYRPAAQHPQPSGSHPGPSQTMTAGHTDVHLTHAGKAAVRIALSRRARLILAQRGNFRLGVLITARNDRRVLSRRWVTIHAERTARVLSAQVVAGRRQLVLRVVAPVAAGQEVTVVVRSAGDPTRIVATATVKISAHMRVLRLRTSRRLPRGSYQVVFSFHRGQVAKIQRRDVHLD